MEDELHTLIDRRNYLRGRIRIKKEMGWEYTYDEREKNALTWAIETITDILVEE